MKGVVLPQLDIDLPRIPSSLAGGVQVCLVSARADSDRPWVDGSWINGTEAESLSGQIRHSSRLSQSILARVARQEMARRLGPGSHDLRVSLSHTQVGQTIFAAAARSNGPVGLDLEWKRRLVGHPKLQDRILVQSEKIRLAATPREDRAMMALRIWCAKESLAKALGTGLIAPLAQYESELRFESTEYSELRFPRFPNWRAVVISHDEVFLSICVPLEAVSS
ncbi:MAG: 4'-phosphopantetheinyl transferase superfamily protein [Bdellovibrionales bacterium]|nr:4'-phosphopantetheinyl transferase superfamily protein [Bdellovibrionales bacterium]